MSTSIHHLTDKSHKGTFKYHDASGGRSSNITQTIRVLSYGGRMVWPNRHITLIVAKKSLTYYLFCSTCSICGEGGWLKTSYRGLAENVSILSYGGESKIAQKKSHDI